MEASRRGSTLVVILALALLLAGQVYILMVFTSGGFRHTERVDAHVRAIYVGESAFSGLMARLKGAPWADRWFESGPQQETDVALMDGVYSSYIVTVNDPTQNLADVWIEARFDGSLAKMYYRVLYEEDALDFTAQVYPQFFTFLDGSDPTPFTSDLPSSLVLVQSLIDEKNGNEANALATLGQLAQGNDFASVASTLQIPLPGVVPDVTDPYSGPSSPQSVYLGEVDSGLSLIPAPPDPPPPPPPPVNTGLGPENFIDNVSQAFQDIVGARPGTPMPASISGLFENTPGAEGDWNRAFNGHRGKGFCHWMNSGVGQTLDNLARGTEPLAAVALTPPPGQQILDSLVLELNTMTQTRATNAGLTPPASADVTVSVPTAAEYRKVFGTLTDWWCTVGGL